MWTRGSPSTRAAEQLPAEALPDIARERKELLPLSRGALAGSWLALPAAAVVLALAIRALRAPLARAIEAHPTASQLPLPAASGDMRPEPGELALYLLCLVVPPLVVWTLSQVAPRLPRPRLRTLTGAALLVQTATLAGILRLWWFQNRWVYAYFSVTRCVLGLAAVGAVIFAAWAWGRWLRDGVAGAAGTLASRMSAPVAALAAAAYAAVCLRSVVFDDASILGAPTTVSYHLPFTLGEFAAVLNGLTPGVDFFPQYVWFLPYPLAAVFRVTGLTVHTFTLAMAVLSFVALVLQYDLFRRVTGCPWVALALFVPFLALGFHPVELSPGGQAASAFNYFAVAPLRYFGPWGVGWLVAWYLSSPAAWRAWVLFAAAGASALNNLDFGVPSLGGAMLAVGLTALANPGPRARPLLRLLGTAALGLATGCAAFQAAAFQHSGRLVHLSDLTVFQRAFAVLGFGMLPMPPWGLHWVVYLTFMLALGTAVVRLAALRAAPVGTGSGAVEAERLLCGALAYAGVFGAGALSYYVGRSHWAVLPAVFAAWGAALVLLAWLALRGGLPALRREPLRIVPAILALVALGIGVGEALPLRFPQEGLYAPTLQVGVETVRHVVDAPRDAARLRALAPPGEKVMVSFPAGHLTAQLAGVKNVFPFVEAGSCLVVGQLDEVVVRMRANRVTTYFGPAAPELKARVAAAGLSVRFVETLEPERR